MNFWSRHLHSLAPASGAGVRAGASVRWKNTAYSTNEVLMKQTVRWLAIDLIFNLLIDASAFSITFDRHEEKCLTLTFLFPQFADILFLL